MPLCRDIFLPREGGKKNHLLIDFSPFLLVLPSVAVLLRTCSFSLAKSFMREASQRLTLVCFVRENSTSAGGFVTSLAPPSRFSLGRVLAPTIRFSHFRVPPPSMGACEITLMRPDPRLAGPIQEGGISQEGVGQA